MRMKMSIAALDHHHISRIEGSGYKPGMSFDSPDLFPGVGEKVSDEVEREGDLDSCSSSSSSSIGKNSDLSVVSGGRSSSDAEDTEEVQSSYKGPLNEMEALEEVLPMRRGISSFYNGKSKSFTSLADTSSSSSIKDLVKPENAYTKKRRNLLACSLMWDKNRNFPLRSNGGGISKRLANSSRISLALAVAISNSGSTSTCDNAKSNSNLISRSPPLHPSLHAQLRQSHYNMSLTPPPRQNFSAWRSFSFADLQQCASVVTSNTAEPPN